MTDSAVSGLPPKNPLSEKEKRRLLKAACTDKVSVAEFHDLVKRVGVNLDNDMAFWTTLADDSFRSWTQSAYEKVAPLIEMGIRPSELLSGRGLLGAINNTSHAPTIECLIRHAPANTLNAVFRSCWEHRHLFPHVLRPLMDRGVQPQDNFNKVAESLLWFGPYWESLFCLVTHPNFPLNERRDMHRLLNHRYKETPAISHKVDVDDIGKAGSADRFACMMHVYTAATMMMPLNTEPAACLPLLTNMPAHWVEHSRNLAPYTAHDMWDIKDMLGAYVEQVVMPCMRYHLSPKDCRQLRPHHLSSIKEELMKDLIPEIIKDKTLFDLIELSQKWHKNFSVLDTNIRRIHREGTWHALISKNKILKVPDGIAKDWTIKNITEADDLIQVGAQLSMCLGGRVLECCAGKNHVFAFYDPSGKPSSTLRVSVATTRNEARIKVKNAAGLIVEDHTNFHNIRNFSPGDVAAYEWLVKSLRRGEIRLQYSRAGQTDKPKLGDETKHVSAIEQMVGYPIYGKSADMYHQRAFEQWGCAGNALKKISPHKLSYPKAVYNRHTAISSGAYRLSGPDIGTHKGKYLIPEKCRDYSPAYYHFKTGQDKILRSILAGIVPAELLVADKHARSAKLRREQLTSGPAR